MYTIQNTNPIRILGPELSGFYLINLTNLPKYTAHTISFIKLYKKKRPFEGVKKHCFSPKFLFRPLRDPCST